MPTLAEIVAIGPQERSRASEIAFVAFAANEVRPVVEAAAPYPVAQAFDAAVAAYLAAVGADEAAGGLRQAVEALAEAASPLDVEVRADQLSLEAIAVAIDGVAVLGPDGARAAGAAAWSAIALVEALERTALGRGGPRTITPLTPFVAPGPLTEGVLQRWAVIRAIPDDDLRAMLARNDADTAAAALRACVTRLLASG